jgi:hypothetical protein
VSKQWGLAGVALSTAVGCALLTSLDDLGVGLDAGDAGDAAVEANVGDADAGTTFHDLKSPSSWSTFDVGTLRAATYGFLGGAFDGRYVYLVPSVAFVDAGVTAADGVVARYDTKAAFDASSSWTLFDTTTVSPSAKGYRGAAFDGRYLYCVPNNDGAPDGVIARYDTQAAFTDAASWTTFDLATVDARAVAFAGGTFDGRYLELAPGTGSGVAARYDTQAAFQSASSWSTFDLATLSDGGAIGYLGAVFDGRYAYFAPNNSPTVSGRVARVDTTADFTSSSSWAVFDTTTANAKAAGYCTDAFDGRYVFFVPCGNSSTVTRYDTHASFGSSLSWSFFDTTTVDTTAASFRAAGFDGRFLYFLPQHGFTTNTSLARYDTQGGFGVLASWTTLDTTTIDPALLGFKAAIFDGEYLYLSPNQNGVVARFDAKSPPSMPALPAWHGSFF